MGYVIIPEPRCETMTEERATYSRARALFANTICGLTLLLIGAGAAVTSTNSGLAVPDWPTSFGYHMWSMPFSMWKGGIFYEHFHRVVASVLGLFVLIMCVWLIAKESRRRIRFIGIGCLAAVVVQGCLGGLTVLMKLPTSVSVFHGVLGQVFLCLSLWLAFELSQGRATQDRRSGPMPEAKRLRGLTLGLLILVICQLTLAATMRHDFKHMGGVAIPDFPTVAGQWVPNLTSDSTVQWVNQWRQLAVDEHGASFDPRTPVQFYQVLIHFLHRTVALIILVTAVLLTLRAKPLPLAGHGIRGAIYVIDGFVVLAVVLGMLTVWSSRGPLVTSLHVVTGAAILGTCVLLLLRVSCPALSGSSGSAAEL